MAAELDGPALLELLCSPGDVVADRGDEFVPVGVDGVHWLQVVVDPQVEIRTTLPRPTVIVHASVDVWLWLLDEPIGADAAEAACRVIASHLGTWWDDKGAMRPVPVPGKPDAVTGGTVRAVALGEPVRLEDLLPMGVGHTLKVTS